MRTRTRFLAVAAAALFAAQARAQEDLGELSKLNVSLSEVTSFPEAYRRVPFDIELLYHGPRDLYNPYYTLFEPASYLNFAAWTADQAIWTHDAYVNDYPLFYVERKNSTLERTMISMKPFTWFTAHCIVKSTAQGRAWIEVLSVVQSPATLDTSDLRHLVRANVLASNGEFDRSLLEFGMAKMFGAPAKFVARYHADEGRVALAANQPSRAVSELSVALGVLPDDKEIIALLDRATGTVQQDRHQSVASVPTNLPPPLNLNGGTLPPKAQEPKTPDPKAAGAKTLEAKSKSEPAKTAAAAPTPAPADAPKSDVTKSDAAKSSTAKSTTTKVDAPKVDAPKSNPTPAVEPSVDSTTAPKTAPVVPPKSDEKPAPDEDAPKVPAEKPAPDAPKDGDKPEEKKDVTDAPKPDETPAPDAPKPEEKQDGTPDPDAPKDGDKPEEKKEGDPAPDAPKPDEKPADKPDETPADKPVGTPADKPEEKPADKPKSGGR